MKERSENGVYGQELTNEKPQAIRFYIKSAKILETRREVTSRLNKGYIRYWIAQLLEDKGEAEKSAAVYRAAILMWQDSSPPRASKAENSLDQLIKLNNGLDNYRMQTQDVVENIYVECLNHLE